jgi:predicted dehydrogenase
MMETSVYGREFRYVRSLADAGRLGSLTMFRGFHLQNLDGYPEYWRGYPPMKYLTHALAPLLALTDSQVERVTALGTGTLTPDRVGAYDNPFPAEVGLFRLTDSDVAASVQMSFFQTGRSYVEGFDVYGDRGGVEWPQVDGEPMRVYDLQELADDLPETGLRGRRSTSELVDPPDLPGDLEPALRRYLREFPMPPLPDGTVELRRAEHGGAHPYLVDAFVRSALSGEAPWVDVRRSAAWTAPGICAHESALAGGSPVEVPQY